MKGLSCILLLLLAFGAAQGQSRNQRGEDTIVKPGTIEIVLDDPYIDSLLAAYQSQASKDQTIKGYRVQILAVGSRTEVNKVKSQFYTLFPDIKTFVIYQQPNFKLRVGNFRTRLEAHKVLLEVKGHFPSAFITPDELKLSDF